jgi:hypothetical protein
MKNMTELTHVASRMAMGLLDGSIDVRTACEANNTFGKVINAQKCILAAQIAQASGMKITMPYLEGTEALPTIDITPKPKKLRQGK